MMNFTRINSEETTTDSSVASATLSLRRATSYCHANATAMRGASYDSSSDVAADLLIGRTSNNLNGKHRRMLQTRQAYFKHQLSEMSSNASESFKPRTTDAERKLYA